jgi:hypothetical protein
VYYYDRCCEILAGTDIESETERKTEVIWRRGMEGKAGWLMFLPVLIGRHMLIGMKQPLLISTGYSRGLNRPA